MIAPLFLQKGDPEANRKRKENLKKQLIDWFDLDDADRKEIIEKKKLIDNPVPDE